MDQQDSPPTDRCKPLPFTSLRSSSEPRNLQYLGGYKEKVSSPPTPREDFRGSIHEHQYSQESGNVRDVSTIRERQPLAPTVETRSNQNGKIRKVQFACRECRKYKVGYPRNIVLLILTSFRDAAARPELGIDVKDAQRGEPNAFGIEPDRLPTARSRLQTLLKELHLYPISVHCHHRMFKIFYLVNSGP